jgi:hypothetical protein
VTTGPTKQRIESVLSLLALGATAFVAVHKLYEQVKPSVRPSIPTPPRALPRPRPTRRQGWPCFVTMLVLELVTVGSILDVVLLLTR